MQVTPHPLLFLAATLTFGLAACYPEQPSDIDSADLDVVTTLFDQTANFSTITTFVLPDSVVHFVDPNQGVDTLSHAFDDLILSQVRQNLLALGYVEVSDPAATPPDVVVQVGATATTNFGYVVYDWWSYWGWYYPWYPVYDPSWSTVYPSSTVAYSYETGTLLIAMIDRRTQNATSHTIPVIWTGGVTGLLTGASATAAPRITSGIDQAFAQSPYLQTQ